MIRKPQKLPDPNAAWFDPATGKPKREIYQYFREMDQVMRELIDKSGEFDVRITELELP